MKIGIKKSGIEDALRVGASLGLMGLGSMAGGEIGSLVAGGLTSKFLVKGDFEKKFVWWISVLNALDIFMERFTPRGAI